MARLPTAPSQDSIQEPRSTLDRIRYPDLIFSDSYLDQPNEQSDDKIDIKFIALDQFRERTITPQIEIPDQISRDYAEFIQIDRNSDDSQKLSISMISQHWRRGSYEKIIGPRAQFTQFGVI